jgi:hypothetical protein
VTTLKHTIAEALNASFVLSEEQKKSGLTLQQCLKTEVTLSINSFVNEFKNRWLYQSSLLHPISYERFSGSCFLLMYKNLNVTNLWPAELLSLIRTYAFSSKDPPTTRSKDPTSAASFHEREHVSFSSDLEYTEYLQQLFNSISHCVASGTTLLNEKSVSAFVEAVIEHYGDILESTIIVNFYHCSALIHVPRSRTIDVRRIVADSGYIHSGGTAIYTRSASKAKLRELEDQLHQFLDGYSKKPVYITPYADEFFSPYDSTSPVSLRNGLSEVKLQLRKHFVEGVPLLDCLAALSQSDDFKEKIFVPLGLAPFSRERRAASHTESKGTIWFIVDYGLVTVSERVSRSESNRYLLAYEQAFLNANQFILFKERKPGWYASITQPHTMSAAIVNIVRGTPFSQNYKPNKPRVILDPFCGTGTTLFDAALRFHDAIIVGFDRDRRAFQAIKDNAEFFSLNSTEVEQYKELVSAGLEILEDEDLPRGLENAEAIPTIASTNSEIFRFVLSSIYSSLAQPTIARNIQNSATNGFDDFLNEKIFHSEGILKTRFAFYLLWRAMTLGTFSIRENISNLRKVFVQELEKVKAEIEHLHQTLLGSGRSDVRTSVGMFAENTGLYSRTLFADPDAVKRLHSGIKHITFDQMKEMGPVKDWSPGIWLVETDSLDGLKLVKDSVDILLTDPPYGFNSQQSENEALMNCYGQLAPLLVGALTNTGQLAMVLPAFAKNGREIPFYQTSRSITRQIIDCAKRAKKSMSDDVRTIPQPYQLFTRPYYWVSTSVLERAILHFRVNQFPTP